MLHYNEITPKKYIVFEGEPYEVLASNTAKKNRQKPVNQTKLKNLISGRVVDQAFHQSDKVEEADLKKRTIRYIYTNKGEFWFCDPENPKDRFMLPEELIGEKVKFMKENGEVEGLSFEDEIIGITTPIKMDFKVTEAAPAVRGNTAQGATKTVVIETGTQITTPLFVNEGDIIRVNTETGEYAERVEKA
ncbi:MAG: elongation factor P [Candidatus Pacebacteria bacterium]|nr:elongation factor P [Candidatus Paceibacterota bacterium]